MKIFSIITLERKILSIITLEGKVFGIITLEREKKHLSGRGKHLDVVSASQGK